MAKSARPSPHVPYSDEIAEIILDRLKNGESLRKICASDGLPHRNSVFRWLDEDEIFRAKYARAREIQAEHMAEEILEIADETTADVIEVIEGEGPRARKKRIANSENVQRSRLRIETRRWVMEKLFPKKFGAHSKVEHTGHLTLEKLVEASMAKKDEE